MERRRRGVSASTALVGMLVTGLLACGAAASRRAASPIARDSTPDASIDPAASGEGLPALDALATRGAAELPLMHEAGRGEDIAARPVTIEAGASDACFRAIVAASAPVHVGFEDDKRGRRGDSSDAPGPDAAILVPPHGPVCARKGEALRLVVQPGDAGARPYARAVLWRDP